MVGTSVDVVGHADGTGVWLGDVGQTGSPSVGAAALVVKPHLVALQVSHLTWCYVFAIDGATLYIHALRVRQGIVNGHDNARHRHSRDNWRLLVGIGVLLIATQLEGVGIVLHKHGATVFVSDVAAAVN